MIYRARRLTVNYLAILSGPMARAFLSSPGICTLGLALFAYLSLVFDSLLTIKLAIRGIGRR